MDRRQKCVPQRGGRAKHRIDDRRLRRVQAKGAERLTP